MMPAAIIDTHCHLDVAAFDDDREAVIAAARAAGVGDIVVPAIHRAGFDGLLALCDGHPGLHPALGLHPVYLDRHLDHHVAELDHYLSLHRPLAVGEIGLDHFLRELDRERQRALCAAQLRLAARHELPVILHVRKAHDEMLALLDAEPVPGGIVHAFNGSLAQGEKYIQRGFVLGFGGMLTFDRSRRLRALAEALSMQSLVLETDAPDMSPARHRGERNSPVFLPECLAALAQVRRLPVDEVALATTANACRVLHLSPGTAP